MNNKPGLFARLTRSREVLARGLAGIFSSATRLDNRWYEELEDQLIMADMGARFSHELVERLRQRAAREKPDTPAVLVGWLKQEIRQTLENAAAGVEPVVAQGPRVVLMVGVNGVGKTTTLGKLARHYQSRGKRVMLAAGDTFRAAAIEQLKSWAAQSDIPLIAQGPGADAAAVAFDAVSAARARAMDYLFIDTAGRQHTRDDLMAQLQKMKRVIAKVDAAAPHDVLLTVDAGTGQNALTQVAQFNQAIALTGLCVTKLDGTAKGGVVVALASQFGIPIRYIGVGEGVDDLRPFDAGQFADALIADSNP